MGGLDVGGDLQRPAPFFVAFFPRWQGRGVAALVQLAKAAVFRRAGRQTELVVELREVRFGARVVVRIDDADRLRARRRGRRGEPVGRAHIRRREPFERLFEFRRRRRRGAASTAAGRSERTRTPQRQRGVGDQAEAEARGVAGRGRGAERSDPVVRRREPRRARVGSRGAGGAEAARQDE